MLRLGLVSVSVKVRVSMSQLLTVFVAQVLIEDMSQSKRLLPVL